MTPEEVGDWISHALEMDRREEPDFPEWPRSFYESLTIELKPGRALLRSAFEPYVVEIHFEKGGRVRRRPGVAFYPSSWGGILTKVERYPDPGYGLDLMQAYDDKGYLFAITAYLEKVPASASFRRLPRLMPEQGKAASSTYYRDLLLYFKRLQAEGSMRPAADLAERLGKNRATIRTHLKKAREMFPNIANGTDKEEES